MENTPKIKQNLDTGFLKLIAIITMLIDHIGKIFFEDVLIFGVVGRIAFPLFAYCIVVGCLYTRDFKKYILRLAVFGVVSQPFYTFAFHPAWEDFILYLPFVNIFFTLIAGALAVYACMHIKKYWWLLLVSLAMELFIGLEYGIYGIIMMVIFYLCRDRSALSAALSFLWMCTMMVGSTFVIGGFGVDLQFFAVLALPLIYVHTNFRPKIHKYFFYAFYPAHFVIIILLRWALRL